MLSPMSTIFIRRAASGLVLVWLVAAVTACTSQMRGLLVLGHEVRTLQPCGDARVYWVHVPDAALREQLEARYRRLATRPYDALYVEIEGEFVDRPSARFAADYDGTLAVRELISISRDGVDACHSPEPTADPGRKASESVVFRALGNEPGWKLEIFDESRIVLIADYGDSRVERPLPEPAVDRAARTTRWDAGELIVDVTDRLCRDTMSGEAFEATVVVTWGERTLRGCGRALH